MDFLRDFSFRSDQSRIDSLEGKIRALSTKLNDVPRDTEKGLSWVVSQIVEANKELESLKRKNNIQSTYFNGKKLENLTNREVETELGNLSAPQSSIEVFLSYLGFSTGNIEEANEKRRKLNIQKVANRLKDLSFTADLRAHKCLDSSEAKAKAYSGWRNRNFLEIRTKSLDLFIKTMPLSEEKLGVFREEVESQLNTLREMSEKIAGIREGKKEGIENCVALVKEYKERSRNFANLLNPESRHFRHIQQLQESLVEGNSTLGGAAQVLTNLWQGIKRAASFMGLSSSTPVEDSLDRPVTITEKINWFEELKEDFSILRVQAEILDVQAKFDHARETRQNPFWGNVSTLNEGKNRVRAYISELGSSLSELNRIKREFNLGGEQERCTVLQNEIANEKRRAEEVLSLLSTSRQLNSAMQEAKKLESKEQLLMAVSDGLCRNLEVSVLKKLSQNEQNKVREKQKQRDFDLEMENRFLIQGVLDKRSEPEKSKDLRRFESEIQKLFPSSQQDPTKSGLYGVWKKWAKDQFASSINATQLNQTVNFEKTSPIQDIAYLATILGKSEEDLREEFKTYARENALFLKMNEIFSMPDGDGKITACMNYFKKLGVADFLRESAIDLIKRVKENQLNNIRSKEEIISRTVLNHIKKIASSTVVSSVQKKTELEALGLTKEESLSFLRDYESVTSIGISEEDQSSFIQDLVLNLTPVNLESAVNESKKEHDNFMLLLHRLLRGESVEIRQFDAVIRRYQAASKIVKQKSPIAAINEEKKCRISTLELRDMISFAGKVALLERESKKLEEELENEDSEITLLEEREKIHKHSRNLSACNIQMSDRIDLSTEATQEESDSESDSGERIGRMEFSNKGEFYSVLINKTRNLQLKVAREFHLPSEQDIEKEIQAEIDQKLNPLKSKLQENNASILSRTDQVERDQIRQALASKGVVSTSIEGIFKILSEETLIERLNARGASRECITQAQGFQAGEKLRLTAVQRVLAPELQGVIPGLSLEDAEDLIHSFVLIRVEAENTRKKIKEASSLMTAFIEGREVGEWQVEKALRDLEWAEEEIQDFFVNCVPKSQLSRKIVNESGEILANFKLIIRNAKGSGLNASVNEVGTKVRHLQEEYKSVFPPPLKNREEMREEMLQTIKQDREAYLAATEAAFQEGGSAYDVLTYGESLAPPPSSILNLSPYEIQKKSSKIIPFSREVIREYRALILLRESERSPQIAILTNHVGNLVTKLYLNLNEFFVFLSHDDENYDELNGLIAELKSIVGELSLSQTVVQSVCIKNIQLIEIRMNELKTRYEEFLVNLSTGDNIDDAEFDKISERYLKEYESLKAELDLIKNSVDRLEEEGRVDDPESIRRKTLQDNQRAKEVLARIKGQGFLTESAFAVKIEIAKQERALIEFNREVNRLKAELQGEVPPTLEQIDLYTEALTRQSVKIAEFQAYLRSIPQENRQFYRSLTLNGSEGSVSRRSELSEAVINRDDVQEIYIESEKKQIKIEWEKIEVEVRKLTISSKVFDYKKQYDDLLGKLSRGEVVEDSLLNNLRDSYLNEYAKFKRDLMQINKKLESVTVKMRNLGYVDDMYTLSVKENLTNLVKKSFYTQEALRDLKILKTRAGEIFGLSQELEDLKSELNRAETVPEKLTQMSRYIQALEVYSAKLDEFLVWGESASRSQNQFFRSFEFGQTFTEISGTSEVISRAQTRYAELKESVELEKLSLLAEQAKFSDESLDQLVQSRLDSVIEQSVPEIREKALILIIERKRAEIHNKDALLAGFSSEEKVQMEASVEDVNNRLELSEKKKLQSILARNGMVQMERTVEELFTRRTGFEGIPEVKEFRLWAQAEYKKIVGIEEDSVLTGEQERDLEILRELSPGAIPEWLLNRFPDNSNLDRGVLLASCKRFMRDQMLESGKSLIIDPQKIQSICSRKTLKEWFGKKSPRLKKARGETLAVGDFQELARLRNIGESANDLELEFLKSLEDQLIKHFKNLGIQNVTREDVKKIMSSIQEARSSPEFDSGASMQKDRLIEKAVLDVFMSKGLQEIRSIFSEEIREAWFKDRMGPVPRSQRSRLNPEENNLALLAQLRGRGETAKILSDRFRDFLVDKILKYFEDQGVPGFTREEAEELYFRLEALEQMKSQSLLEQVERKVPEKVDQMISADTVNIQGLKDLGVTNREANLFNRHLQRDYLASFLKKDGTGDLLAHFEMIAESLPDDNLNQLNRELGTR